MGLHAWMSGWADGWMLLLLASGRVRAFDGSAQPMRATVPRCRQLLGSAPSSVEASMALIHAPVPQPQDAAAAGAPAAQAPTCSSSSSPSSPSQQHQQQGHAQGPDEPQPLVCLSCHGWVDASDSALQAAFDVVSSCTLASCALCRLIIVRFDCTLTAAATVLK